MAKEYSELIQEALDIQNEFRPEQNSAIKVGSTLNDIVERIIEDSTVVNEHFDEITEQFNEVTEHFTEIDTKIETLETDLTADIQALQNKFDIYNVTTEKPLSSGYYNTGTARMAVPQAIRKVGLIITYQTGIQKWVTEQHIGGTGGLLSNWLSNSNWKSIGDQTTNTIIIGGVDMPADTSKDSLSYRDKVQSVLDSFNDLPDSPAFGERYCTLSTALIISKVGIVTIVADEVTKYSTYFTTTSDVSGLDVATVYYLQDTFFANLTNKRHVEFPQCSLQFRFNHWILVDKDGESINYEKAEILDFGFIHSGDKSSWVYELLPPTGYSIYEYSPDGWKEYKLTPGDQFRVLDNQKEYFINSDDQLQENGISKGKTIMGCWFGYAGIDASLMKTPQQMADDILLKTGGAVNPLTLNYFDFTQDKRYIAADADSWMVDTTFNSPIEIGDMIEITSKFVDIQQKNKGLAQFTEDGWSYNPDVVNVLKFWSACENAPFCVPYSVKFKTLLLKDIQEAVFKIGGNTYVNDDIIDVLIPENTRMDAFLLIAPGADSGVITLIMEIIE